MKSSKFTSVSFLVSKDSETDVSTHVGGTSKCNPGYSTVKDFIHVPLLDSENVYSTYRTKDVLELGKVTRQSKRWPKKAKSAPLKKQRIRLPSQPPPDFFPEPETPTEHELDKVEICILWRTIYSFVAHADKLDEEVDAIELVVLTERSIYFVLKYGFEIYNYFVSSKYGVFIGNYLSEGERQKFCDREAKLVREISLKYEMYNRIRAEEAYDGETWRKKTLAAFLDKVHRLMHKATYSAQPSSSKRALANFLGQNEGKINKSRSSKWGSFFAGQSQRSEMSSVTDDLAKKQFTVFLAHTSLIITDPTWDQDRREKYLRRKSESLLSFRKLFGSAALNSRLMILYGVRFAIVSGLDDKQIDFMLQTFKTSDSVLSTNKSSLRVSKEKTLQNFLSIWSKASKVRPSAQSVEVFNYI